MKQRKVIVTPGQKFHKLTVILSNIRVGREIYHRCKCDCGTEKTILARNVEKGKSKSCGCLSREKGKEHATHGLSGTRIYQTWSRMCRRCDNPKVDRFKNYGGRGIRVCDRWKNFENFYADMGDIPGPGFSLGRIDNDKDYCPENCRWETAEQQQNNTSRTIWIEYAGIRMSLRQWATKLGVPYSLLMNRYKAGWSDEAIISERRDQRQLVTHGGVTKLTTEWMKDLGIPISSFYHFIRKGMSREEVVQKYASQIKGGDA